MFPIFLVRAFSLPPLNKYGLPSTPPFEILDPPLLGSVPAQKMGLITVKHENILNVTEAVDKTDFEGLSMREINATYNDVFKGLGCMEGKLHLEVDERVTRDIMH